MEKVTGFQCVVCGTIIHEKEAASTHEAECLRKQKEAEEQAEIRRQIAAIQASCKHPDMRRRSSKDGGDYHIEDCPDCRYHEVVDHA